MSCLVYGLWMTAGAAFLFCLCAWFVTQWGRVFRSWPPLARVVMPMVLVVVVKVAGTKTNTLSAPPGFKAPTGQIPTPRETTGSPACLSCGMCHGYPFCNSLVASAIAGLEPATNACYRELPQVFVDTRIVLAGMRTNAETGTNRVETTIEILSRDGAKERGVLEDTPFPVNAQTSVGVYVPPRVSLGARHGLGRGNAPWRCEVFPVDAPLEVRPDLDPGSRVIRSVTTNANGQAVSSHVTWNKAWMPLPNDPAGVFATLEVEWVEDGKTTTLRYLDGFDHPALAGLAFGVQSNGADWFLAPGLTNGLEVTLCHLGAHEEEMAIVPELMLNHFDAWWWGIDLESAHDIPPGLLLWLGLCPFHPETWNDALPPDFVHFMDYHGYSLEYLLMVQMINPFAWTPDINDIRIHDPLSNPSHPFLNPGNGSLVQFIQTAPISEGTLAQLIVNNLRLPLSSGDPKTYALYLPKGGEFSFELRALCDPLVALTITSAPPTTIWLNDPDNIFGFEDAGNQGGGGGGGGGYQLLSSGGGGGGGGGKGKGQIVMPTMWFTPEPQACVRNGVTDWLGVEFTPSTYNYFDSYVTWVQTAWSAERDSQNRTRLHVTDDSRTSKLTAYVSQLYAPWVQLGELSASVDFHVCGTPEHPVDETCPNHDQPGNPVHDLNVRLTTSKHLLTLKHDNEAVLQIEHNGSPNDFDAYRIEITFTNELNWVTLTNAQQAIPWTATVAGVFHLRGVVTSNSTDYASPNINATVQFPSASEIHPSLGTLLTNVWLQTIADVTNYPPLKREYTGFIILNTATNEYDITNVKAGEWIPPDQDAETKISIRPQDIPANPNPIAKPTYYIAWFHTHTPSTFQTTPSGGRRDVGPSEDDYKVSNDPKMKLPGFVYDYVGFPWSATNNCLFVGHNLNDPAKVYPITPPERRPLP